MGAKRAESTETARGVSGLLASQLRRIDRCWTRFEATGEDKWMAAAIEADRMYLRMKERLS